MVVLQDSSSTLTVHPIGETASLGPWAITVVEVVSGEEAASFLSQTNSENPAAPDGQVYVCARITAQNTSDMPHSIQMVDFAGTGSDGILRRTQAVVMPEPMLQAVVEPGESTEGWIAITVNDPGVAALWFDSPILGGDWSDGLFALADGATAPVVETLDASDTDVGSDPSNPAAIGDTVTVGGWEVTINQVIFGTDVFDAVDFRTQALGSSNAGIPRWVGLYSTVRNLNPFPAFFSDIAFEITDFTGEAWDHTMTLTAPEPDVSQEYLPGATGEGWAAFEPASYASNDLIKVQPFRTGGPARYVIFDGNQPVASGSASDDDAAGAETTSEPLDLAAGDLVQTSEDLVNLRSEASTSGDPIEELPIGTELEITGEPTQADGYTWYPVRVVETSEEGHVVEDFIERAGE